LHHCKLKAIRYTIFILLIACLSQTVQAQKDTSSPGIIMGLLLDVSNHHAISGATVSLGRVSDTGYLRSVITVKDGAFLFEGLPYGYYRLRFTSGGFSAMVLDSIHIRSDRFDFDLNEIRLNRNEKLLEEVVVYAEKPLIENKDGKIIFNTGESALSSGSTTSELLKQTPLVSLDNDGKIMLRGKEPKVLIDDKPVELNAKQLQDLLESMPGSMIEKIEVMTTPPPQYASERGGVINIITKKGKVGFTARLNLNYGTRGEAGTNGNLSYRKNKFAINFTAGFGYNQYAGSNTSYRQNFFTDSVNYFNTTGISSSRNRRPNLRLSLDYDLNKRNSLNFTTLYNSNDGGSETLNTYSNISNALLLYKLSERRSGNTTGSTNPNFSLTYTHKGKVPGTVLKLITGANINSSDVERDYFQQYLNPDLTLTGQDSTQQQHTKVKNNTLSVRINYDRLLKANKLSMNLGSHFIRFNSHNVLNTVYLKKPENLFITNGLLSNDIRFHQSVFALRGSLRYEFIPEFYLNAGLQAEHTTTLFDLSSAISNGRNDYWTALPFATLVKKWKNEVSFTFSYKRTLQRPGLNELNPGVDYADPYNTRSGNPQLRPWHADNFDLIVGKWNKKYYVNASVGYNSVRNIYSSIRTLQPDGKTHTTWENSSGRDEYEASAWGGYTFGKKLKLNLSLGYTYNAYSRYDRVVRFFRNGGSLVSTLNGSYQFSEVMNANGNFTFNRFANPQGRINNTLSMNVGIQRKFFKKKMSVSLNFIDPFRQQRNTAYTYSGNFSLQTSSATQTRNVRVALSYNFSRNPKKNNRQLLLKKAGVNTK